MWKVLLVSVYHLSNHSANTSDLPADYSSSYQAEDDVEGLDGSFYLDVGIYARPFATVFRMSVVVWVSVAIYILWYTCLNAALSKSDELSCCHLLSLCLIATVL